MLENFAKIPYMLNVFSLSEGFFGQKFRKLTLHNQTFYANENSFFLHIFLSRPVFKQLFKIGQSNVHTAGEKGTLAFLILKNFLNMKANKAT